MTQGAGAPTRFEATGGSAKDPLAAWSVMFRGQASPDELKKIVGLVLNQIINAVKKEQEKSRELRKKLQQDAQDDT